MYCEKLNPMPGNSSLNSFCSSSVSFSLVRLAGHSSNGFSGANNSTLENGEASLPLSGRPCCDTTVMTSGCRNRISRILPVAAVPASSEMVGGIDALIQKLPSSSAGRNSLPSRTPQPQLKARNAIPSRHRDLRLREAPSAAPAYKLERKARTITVSVSSICLGSSSAARTGVTVKVASNAPASA